MQIIVRKENDVTVLSLSGRLIVGEPVQVFRDRIREILDAGAKRLVINLEGLSYLDSSGLGALTGAHKAVIGAGARCRLCSPSAKVMDLIKMVSLHRVFDLHEDEASALHGF